MIWIDTNDLRPESSWFEALETDIFGAAHN